MVHMSETKRFIELLRGEIAVRGVSERRFEDMLGLKKWSLRGLLDPKRSQSPSIDKAKEISDALGWEFYIGPRRSEPARTDAAVVEIALPEGRTWCVPETDPGDVFFFRPKADFLDGGRGTIVSAGTWGLAERSYPLGPDQAVVVQRERDGGLNIGRVRYLNDDGSVSLDMHGRAGGRDWAQAEIRGIWPITWRGVSPPAFAISGLDTTSSRDTLVEFRHRIAEFDDMIEKVLSGE